GPGHGLFEKEKDGFGRRFPVRFGRRRKLYLRYGGWFSFCVWHRIRLWLCGLPPNISSCVWTGACVPLRTCLCVASQAPSGPAEPGDSSEVCRGASRVLGELQWRG